jgi:hypothetical protein
VSKPRYTLAKDEDQAREYRRQFIEFSKAELLTGGPDQSITVIGELARRYVTRPDWLVGCFMAPYTTPGALAIYDAWSDAEHALDIADEQDIAVWFQDNWEGLPVRKERRPCRSPKKMAEYLASYARWSTNFLPKAKDADYETLWRSLDGIKYIGRYAGMKLLESLRRGGIITAEMPDIRAGKGGDWSPRLAFSYLYPEFDLMLNRDSSQATAASINRIAGDIYPMYKTAAGIPDMYTFEVLLCDFAQHLKGTYPPGKPLNSEWNHLQKVESWLGFSLVDTDPIWRLRSELFPHEYLREISGWVPPE